MFESCWFAAADFLFPSSFLVFYLGELDHLRMSYKNQRAKFVEGCDKAAWIPNREAQVCMVRSCNRKFTKTVRKHHCRVCGWVVCKKCSKQRFDKAGLALAKVCPICFDFLTEVADGNVKQATQQFASILGQAPP